MYLLVTCALGVNRSALVAALAMILLAHKPGWWAIEQIRQKRTPRARAMLPLSNSSFVDYLRSLGGDGKEIKTAMRAAREGPRTWRSPRILP